MAEPVVDEELVERVALAICREVDDPSCFRNETEAIRCYSPHARAAIDAVMSTRG